MYTLKKTDIRSDLRQADGGELLLMAVFGPADLKPRIDRELDRRALAGTAGGGGFMTRSTTFMQSVSGHAA
jgi:hypothetical protein